MKEILMWALGGVLAYLLGSVPFGFIIAKSQGKDIRTLGSGNIGATNVFRSISKKLGVITFALDVGKGVGGVLLVPLLGGWISGAEPEGMSLSLFCGAMTIAGHNWTCFLRFKGGKGIATSAGMLIGLAPIGVGIAFLGWLVTFLATRYVSAASIIACVVLAIVVWPIYMHQLGIWFPAVLTFLAFVGIWKHRDNILRLKAGTESRFNFKRF
ncbi:MAG: glycerol-3-phosphate 1-O-acyltransferase PlsY [Kiritimatiellae bacterium]|nr:glycerol-3-phosphate 1-O-acyltransferase PlsY [Kiritimatiellia bacterium]